MENFYKRQDDQLFYANIKVKLPLTVSDTVFDAVFDTMQHIDSTYNSYTLGAYLHTINAQAGNWVSVDNTCIELIKHTIEIAHLFEGKYDISILPLLEFWGFYKKEALTYPKAEALVEILKTVNYKLIEIEDNQIRIQPNQKLISGSFIKAYAVDKAIEIIKSFHIKDALINAGGSTIYGLANEKQAYWEVQITNPINKIPNSLFKIKIKNECFSTSIQNENPLILEGKKVGHIINAKTGLPSSNLQVGIISQNAMLGDMLSTAFMLCQAEEFQYYMAKNQAIYPHIEGFLIDEKGEVYFSAQFSKYII